MMDAITHATYILDFIDTYKRFSPKDLAAREAACLRARVPYILDDLREGEFFAGRYRKLAVGFAPQEEAGMGYFLNRPVYEAVYQQQDAQMQARLDEAISFWEKEVTAYKLRAGYPEEIAAVLPSDAFTEEKGVAFPLCRMGGTHPDYKKLVRLGIPGLRKEIEEKIPTAEESSKPLYSAMLDALDLLCDVCRYYEKQAGDKGLDALAGVLRALPVRAPQNMREALQLIHLYAILSGSFNYGRMDDYLGCFAEDDNALDCVIAFWKVVCEREITWDARVVVGGLGRENEEEADRFALLAMEASRQYRDILPQLTLRFYDGQNPALLKKAYDNFAEGVVYPMLYKDEINIKAVEQAFGVERETAIQYVPFGCGEYVLNHQSVGTPSGVINLLAALNEALEADYDSFDALFEGYARIVERHVDALAWQERFEYRVAAETAPFLYLSMLFDDCIERGRPIFDGGVRYLGGTLESYGNTNTADSLTAIQEIVFEKNLLTLAQLRTILAADFVGYETERRWLLNCPKYGNDDARADAMAVRVHEHLCNYTRQQAERVDLDSYLIVIINNNANTTIGGMTGASADGRHASEPMANANNPAGGMDKSGVTAFLNSLVKLDNTIHAGAVQNMKFSRDLLTKHRDKFEMLMRTYFKKGQQAMLNILSRGDLENALAHPEQYPNLIVRVGGFSARYVELDRKTQEEILSRTLY